MTLSRSIIDRVIATPYGEAAYKVVERLTDAGYDTWWVGGAVRDMLRGHVPDDIDIATAALPDQLRSVFAKSAGMSDALGAVLVDLGRFRFEVTTFREDDDAGDGRRPERVIFGTREQDAKRRDCTVNALYFHPVSRELYDPFGGAGDLQERLVRVIGEPARRFRQDALRLLRVVRLRALFDGQYDPDTYAALRAEAGLVQQLSGERVRQEFEKMLAGPRPDRALEDLWETGLLQHSIPEMAACKGVAQPVEYHHEGDVWDHLLKCARALRADDSADLRLAAVFHDIGKPETFSRKERIRFDHHAEVSADIADDILKRWQCPLRRREAVRWLISHHMMMRAFFEMPPERKAHWYYHPLFTDLLRLFEIDIAGTEPSVYTLYNNILADYNAYLDAHPRPAKPLLSGGDVMEILGIPPGERVGELTAKLLAEQQAGRITTKKEARAFLEKLH